MDRNYFFTLTGQQPPPTPTPAPVTRPSRLSVTDTVVVPSNSSHASSKPSPPLVGKFGNCKPIVDQKKSLPMTDGMTGAFSVSGTQVRRREPPPRATKPVEIIDDGMAMIKEMMKEDMVGLQVSQMADDLQEPSPLNEDKKIAPVLIEDDDDNEIVPDSQEADHSIKELFDLVREKHTSKADPPKSFSTSSRTLRSHSKLVLYDASPADPFLSRVPKRSFEVQDDADFDFNTPSSRKSKRTSKNGKTPVIKGPIPKVPEDFDQFLEECNLQTGRKQADMTFGPLKIKGHDLYSLRQRQYLNDLIIDNYLELICQRNMRVEAYTKCFAFPTYLYPMLKSGKKNPDDLVAWQQKLDFSKHELIFLPINEDDHWYLFVADTRLQNYFIYDSLSLSSYDSEIERISNFLKYFVSKKGLEIDWKEWSNLPTDEQIGPNQSNGTDCGIFLCQYCEHLSRGVKLDYTQHAMPYFRKIMQYELLKGELLPKDAAN